MQYLLLIYDNETELGCRCRRPSRRRCSASTTTFTRASPRAGTTRAATRSSRRTRRRRSACATASVETTDGPFAETREQLGGYYLVDAKDLDEAIGLAAAHSRRAHGLDRSASDHADAADVRRERREHRPEDEIARVFREESGARSRDAHPPPRRLRRRRGGAAGRVRRRAGAVGARRTAGESARVAGQHGPPSRDRPPAPRRALRRARRSDRRVRVESASSRTSRATTTSGVDDDRLRLIFTCCHPALAREAQVALTLRTICGLTTDEIARAFLVPVADDGAATRARDGKDSRRADSVSRSAGRPSSPSGSMRCSPWSISCSPKATRRRAATRSCAASCAARRFGSADCSSS